jgi:hypothetical protein
MPDKPLPSPHPASLYPYNSLYSHLYHKRCQHLRDLDLELIQPRALLLRIRCRLLG